MTEYVRFEGTSDYLVHYPAFITTFTAATAISAGELVIIGRTGTVSGSAGAGGGSVISGSSVVAGLAVRTAASGERVGVIRWGFVKNLLAGNAISQGDYVEALGGAFVGSLGVFSKTNNLNGAHIIGQAVYFGTGLTATSGSKVNVFLSTVL